MYFSNVMKYDLIWFQYFFLIRFNPKELDQSSRLSYLNGCNHNLSGIVFEVTVFSQDLNISLDA